MTSRLMARLAPLACAALLAGCANLSESERGAAQGAAIGAVAGAILSSATGGAAVGGAAGAVGGHLWSKRMQDKQQAMEQATRGSGVQVSRTDDDQLRLQVPGDMSFTVGSANLEPRLRPVLDAFANGLERDPQMLVRVVGHTDNTGSDAINEPLSLRRAESVRNHLEDRGIAGNRIAVAGHGSREPVASDTTADDRARNRRVEVFLRDTQRGGY